MRRSAAALAVLAASFALAAPASAFTPPELYVRLEPWQSSPPESDWIPLASAPALDYLAGYQIGYKVQAVGGDPINRQDLALQVIGVPDGTPTQPYYTDAICDTTGGAVGEIVPAGVTPLQFEGDGTYTVKVSIGDLSGGDTDCMTFGVSNTGSFTVTTMVAPELVGQPFSFRAKPLKGDPLGAGRAAAHPPGGYGDVRCVLGKTTVPSHADDFHRSLSEDDFPRPGAWSCAARGLADGLDDEFDNITFGTPFSAPLAVDVRSDFRRRLGKVSKPTSRRPRFTFKAEWPGLSKGGHAKLVISRVRGCRNHRKHIYKLRKVATLRGTFGAKNAEMRMKRPRRDGYFLGRFSFSGTRLIQAGVDPNPVYLQESFGRLGFASSFPPC